MLKNFLKLIVVKIIEWEARLVLKKYKPKIIGITGSVGKTSVKDAVYLVFSFKYKTRKSVKSYNSELGVPLTILNLKTGWTSVIKWLVNILEGLVLIVLPHSYPKWLVLEIGADRPNDIKKICQWIKPDLVIITRLPDVPAHIEFFPSRDSLIAEKTILAKSVKTGGLVVLNYDDESIRALQPDIKARTMTYGFSNAADIWASDCHFTYSQTSEGEIINGLTFKLNYKNDSLPIWIKGTVGCHHVYTVLAALAAGLSADINIVDLAETLASYQTPPGRMRIIAGIKNTVIIDDTYNASPASMEAGLLALAEIKSGGRKIAVLGDMLELGEHTIEAHKTIGKYAADKAVIALVVGLRAKFIAEGLREAGFNMDNVFYFDNAVAAGQYLQNLIKTGDIIYIKGSQFMRLERIVEEIMLEPERRAELLCRQEPEWQARQ